MKNKESRRRFLETSVKSGLGLLILPEVIPASAMGRDGQIPPSERIRMGVIGCGIHARWNINLMFHNKEQQIVALCDPDREHLESTQKFVEKFYSKETGRSYSVDIYNDFRDLVNRKDIDAVDIVTQDHWHVLMSVFAMKAGKHVICEKPTLTIKEGQILVKTQKETGRVYLTASQNRTVDTNQQIANVVRNGLLGKLRHIKIPLPWRGQRRKTEKRSFEVQPIPKTLDYELWTGPAPLLPYIPARLHNTWRYNMAYSGGVMPDWGAHYINLALWGLNCDCEPAIEYFGNGNDPKTRWRYPDKNDPWNFSDTFDFTALFKNGVTMRVWSDSPGIKFEGDKGWILAKGPSLYDSKLTASDERILTWRPGPDDLDLGRNLRHCMVSKTDKNGLPDVKGGEHVHFTHCIKTGQTPYYTAEMGACNDIISLSGLISMHDLDGGRIHWDHAQKKFIGENSEIANKSFVFSRPQREPWTFAHVDSWINVG